MFIFSQNALVGQTPLGPAGELTMLSHHPQLGQGGHGKGSRRGTWREGNRWREYTPHLFAFTLHI